MVDSNMYHIQKNFYTENLQKHLNYTHRMDMKESPLIVNNILTLIIYFPSLLSFRRTEGRMLEQSMSKRGQLRRSTQRLPMRMCERVHGRCVRNRLIQHPIYVFIVFFIWFRFCGIFVLNMSWVFFKNMLFFFLCELWGLQNRPNFLYVLSFKT